MNNSDLIWLIIIWLSGSVVALLGNEKIRDYKCYGHPKTFLVTGIILSVSMSWAFVLASLMDDTFRLPDWLYHNCRERSSIDYEEEYLDENGSPTTPDKHFAVHNTYRVYTCRKCGKVTKELM